MDRITTISLYDLTPGDATASNAINISGYQKKTKTTVTKSRNKCTNS